MCQSNAYIEQSALVTMLL